VAIVVPHCTQKHAHTQADRFFAAVHFPTKNADKIKQIARRWSQSQGGRVHDLLSGLASGPARDHKEMIDMACSKQAASRTATRQLKEEKESTRQLDHECELSTLQLEELQR
jgi:hypothetical protein